MQYDFGERFDSMTKQQVIEEAIRELDARECIEVEPDADEYDIIYTVNTYFGPDRAFELRQNIIRAELHNKKAVA